MSLARYLPSAQGCPLRAAFPPCKAPPPALPLCPAGDFLARHIQKFEEIIRGAPKPCVLMPAPKPWVLHACAQVYALVCAPVWVYGRAMGGLAGGGRFSARWESFLGRRAMGVHESVYWAQAVGH